MNKKERSWLREDLRTIERKLEQLFKDFRADPNAVVDRAKEARNTRDNIRRALKLN